jgi:hypothetical protein
LLNATDLAILQANFGMWPRGYAAGNVNCDDVVNATDLAILATNFGFSAPTGTPVPEPGALGLLSLGGLTLIRHRKRSSDKERAMFKFPHALLLTVAVTLMIGGPAVADILLISGSVYDVFITDPVAVGDGSENLIAFDLKIVNNTGDAGYDASAFDGVAFGYTGITSGVFNSGTGLHQQYSTVLQPTSPTLDGNYASATDTHFLDVTANMLVVTPPSEAMNDIGPSSEASDALPPFNDVGTFGASTDFGSQLTGTFAVDATPSLSLAHLVIRDTPALFAWSFGTGQVSFDFFISGTKGGEVIRFDLGLPEPATLGLLALGGLTLLKRRRS